MQKQNIAANLSAQKGVVIIEAMVAILIFSVGVLGIVGMQANMVKNTSESKYRADAGYIAQQQIGTMWANTEPAANLDNYVGPHDVSTSLPGGSLVVAKQATVFDSTGTVVGGVYTFTVTWQQPGEAAHNYTTTATIAGG